MEKLYCINYITMDGSKKWKGYRDRDKAKEFVNTLGARFIRMEIALRPAN